MYKIIGPDEKEYGPFTADEIRTWIAQGRAGGNTKVQWDGSTDWKLLMDLQEFADALASAAAARGAIAVPASTRPPVADYHIDIGSLFTRGWNLIQRYPGLTLGGTAIVLVVSIGIEFVPVVGTIAGFLLRGPLLGGLCWLFLKLIHGDKVDIGDVFAGFRTSFLNLMVAGIIIQVAGAIGLLLCIVPGAYLLTVWSFSFPLIIEERLEFWEAMELSRKTVQKQFWQVFALALVCVLLVAAGVVAFGIGIFLTLPLATAMYMYAYKNIFGEHIA
jgi:hypothetical protein